MQRQPDPLQPDDDHQIQAAACQGGQETGDIACGEHPDLEQLKPEHGLRDVLLNIDERPECQRAADQTCQYKGTAPAHRRVSVWLDPIGGADQQGGQAQRKEDITGNIEVLIFSDRGSLVQGQVCPDGAANGKGHTDQENIAPVDGCQDSTGQQAEKCAGCAGNHVDAHGQAALVGWKGICQNGSGIGHQESASDRLDQPEDDDLHGRAIPGAVYQIQQDRADCKDGKAEVVHPYPPPHIRDAAKGDQQGCGDNQVPHQSPK